MLSEIFTKFNRPKIYLLAANVFLVFFLILLANLNILPIKDLPDFLFFTLIYLAFALYRPGWSFLFFIGTIALENINLAPQGIGLAVRPYQFIGGLTILAVLIKLAAGRLGFKLPKFGWPDLAVLVFAAAGFLSAVFALDRGVSFKQSIVAASFAALYFLVRLFIPDIEDLKRVIPFFFSSSAIVVLYSLWQNIRFLSGAASFEVMAGRPNATFTEADWYGIYLVLLLAIIYSIIYYISNVSKEGESLIFNFQFSIFNKFSITKSQNLKIAICGLLVATYVALILTVSRSAWLGALFVTIIFLFAILTQLKINPKNWQWKNTIRVKIPIIISILFSLLLVFGFHLTNFQLFNRVQSTGTGLQKITVACTQNVALPEKIESVSELAQYGCKHIDLEDIQTEKAEGNFVTEIFRTDPNVNIRGVIYQKSWAEIKTHPILGIGWGNIGSILGTDESGHSLNSSNIFLETWLGAGIIGFFAIVLIFLNGPAKGAKFFANGASDDEKTLGLFLILGSFALLIPNLFNAGIFLGIAWVFFALVNITI